MEILPGGADGNNGKFALKGKFTSGGNIMVKNTFEVTL